MALDNTIQNWQHTLAGTTAEQLTDFRAGIPTNGVLKNISAANTIYIGDVNVSSTTGYPLAVNEVMNISQLGNPRSLYVRGAIGDKVAFVGSSI